MQEQEYLPQVVLSSASRRTRETWSLVSSVLGGEPEVRFQRSLYMADALLMIGHNPSMEELAVYLAGSGDADALRSMSRKFPTAALAVLEHRGDRWSELTRGSCHLVEFVRPKDL
jgi:phosphohistidine phosphatase